MEISVKYMRERVCCLSPSLCLQRTSFSLSRPLLRSRSLAHSLWPFLLTCMGHQFDRKHSHAGLAILNLLHHPVEVSSWFVVLGNFLDESRSGIGFEET